VYNQNPSLCLNFVTPWPPDGPLDITYLIWILRSKAKGQSAFCTYVSEIYFYTFILFCI
jgi:hypothetical protein